MLRQVVTACLVVVLSACRATPPVAAVTAPFGSVRGETIDEARTVAAYAAELVPAIRAAVPGLLDRSIEIWVQRQLEIFEGEPYSDHIAGMADFEEARIHVRAGDDRVALHLAHELVHVLAGPTWSTMPGVLEEGLCDVVAAAVVPELGIEQHVKRVVEAAATAGGLNAIVSFRQWRGGDTYRIRAEVRLSLGDVTPINLNRAFTLSSSEVFAKAAGDSCGGLYGIGYLVAHRIVERQGFAGLHRLCLSATERGLERIPAADILAAAAMNASPDSIRSAVADSIGDEELEALARLVAKDLATATVKLCKDMGGDDQPASFLERADPEFRVPHRRRPVKLAHLREFREEFLRAWGIEEI